MDDLLTIQNLTKRFGDKTVLDALCLKVPKGAVYGFIGKNGAGKTTTMKAVLGLLPADAGTITVCGEPAVFGGAKTNKHIGYLPDVPAFYDYMTAREYLNLCRKLVIAGGAERTAPVDELIEKVGLTGVGQKIGGYSRGMKQRLGIAQALIGRPRLLICDEPTSALDPIGRHELLTILQRIKEETTVIFSTHILSDVQSICDHIGILHGGKLAFEGPMHAVGADGRQIAIEFYTPEAAEAFAKLSRPLYNTTLSGLHLTCDVDDGASASQTLLALLGEAALPILSFEVKRQSLQSLFMEVTS